jgi:hypothetical protein
MDNKTQMIIYAIDALECSIRSNLRMIKTLKALAAPEPSKYDKVKVQTFQPPVMPPEPYVCDLTPGQLFETDEDEDEIRGTFSANGEFDIFPPCIHCNHDCTVCSKLDKCSEFECVGCKYDTICSFRMLN